MQLNVGKEIAAMEQMAVGQLRNRYAEVFGETTNARNKQWLLKKIIWRMQSIAEGDLSERARARAMGIVSDADIRRRPPKAPTPKPEAPRSAPIPVPASLDNRVPIPGSSAYFFSKDLGEHFCPWHVCRIATMDGKHPLCFPDWWKQSIPTRFWSRLGYALRVDLFVAFERSSETSSAERIAD
ncbi:MAG: hypothetical protein RLY14_61 [Planctomycetota bacterium]